MITRSGAGRDTIQSSPARRRPPLTESVKLNEKSAESNAQTKLSSPAKRSVLRPATLESSEMRRSPSKRNLGSPVRKPEVKPEVPKESTSQLSPLKRPARRVQIRPSTALEAPPMQVKSPLKKPPTRLFAASPAKLASVTIYTDVDELSLPKRDDSPSKRKAPRTPTRIPKPKEDPDEIASYTPIRIPSDPHCAVSPPSEEVIEDESDLWQPSVPLSITKSMTKLSLNSDMVIFVDCKSLSGVDSSSEYLSQLKNCGARTVDRWNWNPDTQGTPSKRSKVLVTHVVYFNGSIRTLKKVSSARKLGIHVHCIVLSWVKL